MTRRPPAEIAAPRPAEGAPLRHAQRLEILHDIDRAILALQSPAIIAQTALGHLRRLVGAPRATLALYDLAAQQGT